MPTWGPTAILTNSRDGYAFQNTKYIYTTGGATVTLTTPGFYNNVNYQKVTNSDQTGTYGGEPSRNLSKAHVFLYFDSVTIPAGATLTGATLKMWAAVQGSAARAERLYARRHNTPGVPSSPGQVMGASVVPTYKGFSITNATSPVSNKTQFQLVDTVGGGVGLNIQTVIQGLLNQGYDYSGGAAMLFFIKDPVPQTGAFYDGMIYQRDWGTTNAASLQIDYDVPDNSSSSESSSSTSSQSSSSQSPVLQDKTTFGFV
jgi:hypothetical protein